jgi:hypothetical protein
MTTKQAKSEDMNRNPDGKGGFRDNPQNRSNGRWNKDESISYQYNKLMRMTVEELEVFDPTTVAEKIAKQRINEALQDSNKTMGGALKVTKEITDRTDGKAAQYIDMTSNGHTIKGATITFEDNPEPED